MQQHNQPGHQQRTGLRSVTGAVIASLGMIAMVVGMSSGSVAGVADTQDVDLSNDDAPVGTDCPDDVNDY